MWSDYNLQEANAGAHHTQLTGQEIAFATEGLNEEAQHGTTVRRSGASPGKGWRVMNASGTLSSGSRPSALTSSWACRAGTQQGRRPREHRPHHLLMQQLLTAVMSTQRSHCYK